MNDTKSSGSPSFKELEHAGWEDRAGDYDAYVGATTVQAISYLLDATGVTAGKRVLEVACGPGYGAAGVIARGATAIGVDFAAPMVAEARRRVPGAEIVEGDAEALDFADHSFDAVICNFGLLHLPEPDKAIAEAYRVLRPGGGYGFTVWCGPEKMEFFALVLSAVQQHGTLEVDLPPAPPIFRFSDHDECRRSLSAAGFEDVQVEDIELTWSAASPMDVIDCIYKSTVRTAMVLDAQDDDARENIHRTILDGVRRFEKGGNIVMAWPAVMAAARKP